jgi:RNA polymerase sigma-70 factor (ECF subfamily)
MRSLLSSKMLSRRVLPRERVMPWNQEPLKRLMRKVIGASDDSRTPDDKFRDEAIPHLPAVTRFALSLTRDESDAEDLVQETYLRAFRAWDQFVPGSECRAWLFTICRHTYFRTSRREQRVVAYEDAELEALGAAAVHTAAKADGLDDVFSRTDVMDAIHSAIDGLPDPFREVVVLVDLEEQSYEDAARVLDIPRGTVRSRLFRGRRLLQEQLIEHARDAGIVNKQRPGGTREETSNED